MIKNLNLKNYSWIKRAPKKIISFRYGLTVQNTMVATCAPSVETAKVTFKRFAGTISILSALPNGQKRAHSVLIALRASPINLNIIVIAAGRSKKTSISLNFPRQHQLSSSVISVSIFLVDNIQIVINLILMIPLIILIFNYIG